jgi:phosphate transport system permease protein
MIAKNKAVGIYEKGIKMHSQPTQYGWFSALYTGLPAITLGVVGVFLYLFGIELIPPVMLISASLALAAFTMMFINTKISEKTEARNLVEAFIKGMLLFASFISILTTFGILISILFEAIQFFKMEPFWYFLFGTEWAPDKAFLEGAGRAGETGARFGAVPLFAGTFMITAIAMAVALPIGLLSAIYLSEYAKASLKGKLKPILEILAGIPTVVYGFFAAITVAPFIVDTAAMFGLEASFNNALASGVVMGIMIIPIIASLSDDVISSVPKNMREGSLALGMNKAETIRFVVLPSATPGIIAASLLGISRALGETMIVVMAAGLRPNLSINPLEDMTTVTVRIVDALVGDQEFNSAMTLSAFALGLVLFVVTLIINVISVVIIRKFHKKYKMSNL